MKKRNLLLSLLMSFVLLFTACGSTPSPFEGTWKGTWNLADIMMQSIQGSGMEDYTDFSDLELVIDLTFEKDDVSISVSEDSVTAFADTLESTIIEASDSFIEATALESGCTVDDLYAAMNMTRDQYLAVLVEGMDLTAVKDELCRNLDISGTYEYDEETSKFTITYENGEEEVFDYAFNGEALTLNVDIDGMNVVIDCEKQ